MNASDLLNVKIAGLSIDMLIEIAVRTYNDFSEEAGIVFDRAMAALLARMSDAAFCAFAASLDEVA